MNTKINLPLFHDVSDELARLNLYVHSSECHGAICGYLCADQGDDFTLWFAHILLSMSNEALEEGELAPTVDSESASLLKILFHSSIEQIQDPDCGMRLLLPGDDETLNERVDALAEWCHGFLYGLTAAAANEISQYSADAQEVISDFVKMSQSGLESGEEADEDEAAYAEIVEYVRIGALLIWTDARQLQRVSASPPTLH